MKIQNDMQARQTRQATYGKERNKKPYLKESRRRSLGHHTPKPSTPKASVPCKWYGNGLEMKKKVGGRRGAENEKWLGVISYYRI